MPIPVGIDDLCVYGSTLSVEFADIVAARQIPEKEFRHIQLVRRTVLPGYEDPVTLAVNAARAVVDAEGPERFELLVVGTESGFDLGKPISSYVHRYLGLPERCRNLETKHACYGGTAGLQLAAAWVRSRVSPGKKALVVMTDMARRHFWDAAEFAAIHAASEAARKYTRDPGEITCGAGAVALSIGEEPRVLEMEPESGCVSREVFDIARPTQSLELGDPVLSLGAYLDLLELAWAGYRDAAHARRVEEHFAYMLYHTPLVSLVQQAHQALLEAEQGDRTDEEIAASFERMVAPSLRFCREMGNTYSASLYVALAGLLSGDAKLRAGDRIGLYSYGSGSCAEMFSMRAVAGGRERVARHRIADRLATRRRLTIPEYERAVREVERGLLSPNFDPDRDLPSGHLHAQYEGKDLLVLDQVRGYHRTYRTCGASDGGAAAAR